MEYKSRPTKASRARRSVILSLIASLATVFFVVHRYQDSLTDLKANLYSSFMDTPWTTHDELRSLVYFTKTYPDVALPMLDSGLSPITFGAGSPQAAKDWTKEIRALDASSPVVIFSKTYCPYSKRAKALIETYDIEPKPIIIEVDLRADDSIVKQQLHRLTGRGTFPNVLIKGSSLGGSDELHALHASGALRKLLENAGVVVRGSV